MAGPKEDFYTYDRNGNVIDFDAEAAAAHDKQKAAEEALKQAAAEKAAIDAVNKSLAESNKKIGSTVKRKRGKKAAPSFDEFMEADQQRLADSRMHRFSLGDLALTPPVSSTPTAMDQGLATMTAERAQFGFPGGGLELRTPEEAEAAMQRQSDIDLIQGVQAGDVDPGPLAPGEVDPTILPQEGMGTSPAEMESQMSYVPPTQQQREEYRARVARETRHIEDATTITNILSGILPGPLAQSLGEGVSEFIGGSKDAYIEAIEAQRKVATVDQAAMEDRFQTEVETLNKLTEEEEANFNDMMGRAVNRFSSIAELDEQYRSGSINPAASWQDKGLGEKLLLGYSSGLYRALQLKQGTLGGGNPIITALDNAMRTDLAAQEANLNKIIQERGHLRQDQLDDERLTQLKNAALAKSAMNKISGAIAVLNKEMAGNMDEKALAAAQLQLAELEDRWQNAALKVAGSLIAARTAMLKKKGKGGGGGTDKGIAKGMKPTERRIKAYGWEVVTKDAAGNVLTRQPAVDFQDKEIAKDAGKQLFARYQLIKGINKLQLLAGEGGKGMPTSERVIMAKQIAAEIDQAYIISQGRGLSEEDLKVVQNARGGKNPLALLQWAGDEMVMSRFREAKDNAIFEGRTTIQAHLQEGQELQFTNPKTSLKGIMPSKGKDEDVNPTLKQVQNILEDAEDISRVRTAAYNFFRLVDSPDALNPESGIIAKHHNGSGTLTMLKSRLNDFKKGDPKVYKETQEIVKDIEAGMRLNAKKFEQAEKKAAKDAAGGKLLQTPPDLMTF